MTETGPMRERFGEIANLLAADPPAGGLPPIRADETIGRPLGDAGFVAAIEKRTKRGLQPRQRGPKPRSEN